MIQIDYLDQCRAMLTDVFKQLNCTIEDNQIEETSQLIIDRMSGYYR